jgi:hypothetical protein
MTMAVLGVRVTAVLAFVCLSVASSNADHRGGVQQRQLRTSFDQVVTYHHSEDQEHFYTAEQITRNLKSSKSSGGKGGSSKKSGSSSKKGGHDASSSKKSHTKKKDGSFKPAGSSKGALSDDTGDTGGRVDVPTDAPVPGNAPSPGSDGGNSPTPGGSPTTGGDGSDGGNAPTPAGSPTTGGDGSDGGSAPSPGGSPTSGGDGSDGGSAPTPAGSPTPGGGGSAPSSSPSQDLGGRVETPAPTVASGDGEFSLDEYAIACPEGVLDKMEVVEFQYSLEIQLGYEVDETRRLYEMALMLDVGEEILPCDATEASRVRRRLQEKGHPGISALEFDPADTLSTDSKYIYTYIIHYTMYSYNGKRICFVLWYLHGGLTQYFWSISYLIS